MKKSRTSEKVLVTERRRVMTFVLSHVVADKGSNVKVSEIFAAYKAWSLKQGGKTKLSVDSFGQLFPKSFKRKVTGDGQGSTCRVFVDVRIR